MSFRSAIIEEEEVPQQTSQAEESDFKNHLPDNCVEYLLFFLDSQLDARKQLSQIESIRKSAIDLATTLTKDYIWQKDEFNLTLKNEKGTYKSCKLHYNMLTGSRLGVSSRHN